MADEHIEAAKSKAYDATVQAQTVANDYMVRAMRHMEQDLRESVPMLHVTGLMEEKQLAADIRDELHTAMLALTRASVHAERLRKLLIV